jgi:hypothetical protein
MSESRYTALEIEHGQYSISIKSRQGGQIGYSDWQALTKVLPYAIVFQLILHSLRG